MRRTGDQSGFTLIEILLALLILSFVMVVLVESWGGNLRSVKKARRYAVVTMLLQKKVTEFEILTKNKTYDDIKDADQGDFGSDYPEYRWEIKTRPFIMPNILPTKGLSSAIAEQITKTMIDYFEKAVKEVAISVIYHSGKTEAKYTVTTLFVDYNKELPSGP